MVLAQDDRPFEDVLKLAYIARPGILQQLVAGFAVQSGDGFMVFPVVGIQEMLGQQDDVFSPFTERRDVQLDGIDAIKQVLTKRAFVYFIQQLGVGGTNQPHIDMDRFYGTQADNLPFLQCRQQFGLHRKRQVPDFIEEKRAARSHFHPSGLGLVGIGKGPFLVTEKLALEQLFRNASQVDGDKGFRSTGREMLQHTGHQIFSSTVFAQNQDIGICIRETENRVLDLTHGRRFADEFRQGSIVAQSRNLFL